jgi:hypothetical protein
MIPFFQIKSVICNIVCLCVVMMYIVMIIKTKSFSGYSGFIHVVSRGNDSVVVISPDGKRGRT